MKITLETEHTKSTIEVDRDDLDIYDMWMELLRPALIGLGYEKDTVDDLVSF